MIRIYFETTRIIIKFLEQCILPWIMLVSKYVFVVNINFVRHHTSYKKSRNTCVRSTFLMRSVLSLNNLISNFILERKMLYIYNIYVYVGPVIAVFIFWSKMTRKRNVLKRMKINFSYFEFLRYSWFYIISIYPKN